MLSDTNAITKASNAVVIGYGSIGKKHRHFLCEFFDEVFIVSRRPSPEYFVYDELEKCLDFSKPEYVVVASETSRHLHDLDRLNELNFTGTVLVEKPVAPHTVLEREYGFKNICVGYHLRFNPLVLKLRKVLSKEKVLCAHFHVGQYLPAWRPDQDYRRSYSAKSSLGGGVLNDLSHELDLVTWFFEKWHRLLAMGGQLSDLDIDSEDCFSVLLRAKKCDHITVNLNYLEHHKERKIKFLTNRNTYEADLIRNTFSTNGTFEEFNHKNADDYLAMHYAAKIGDRSLLCSLNQGIQTVAMIHKIKSSNIEANWQFNE